MLRTIMIMTAALLITTTAHSQGANYFPMNIGYEWMYDDGTADKVAGLTKAPFDSDEYTAYIFAPYNHGERIFYRIRNRIYEFNNGYGRLCYDFDASVGDSWEMSWKLLISGYILDDSGNIIIPPESDIERMVTDGDDPAASGGDTGSSPPGSESNPMLPPPDDINTGAVVTVIENDAVVETPMGTFRDVCHIRIARPNVSDASYTEEWFAPDVGCIMRVWDTIAGPQQQRIVNTSTPIQPSDQYHLDITLNKRSIMSGKIF